MSDSFYTIDEIAEIVSGKLFINALSENKITDLLTDSRNINHAAGSLFFAIKGERQDGSRFIEDLYNLGVRNFIITDYSPNLQSLKANFILRGLRNPADFEFEKAIAHTNRRLSKIETVFLLTASKTSYISSSIVRDVIRNGGQYEMLVPDSVRVRK